MSAMRQFVIYDHPADAPEHFVVREWNIGQGWIQPASQAQGFRELEKARAWLHQEHPGLVMIGRSPGDDPKILEVWL